MISNYSLQTKTLNMLGSIFVVALFVYYLNKHTDYIYFHIYVWSVDVTGKYQLSTLSTSLSKNSLLGNTDHQSFPSNPESRGAMIREDKFLLY